MAFGIDDVLTTATTAINLGDTLVKVMKGNFHGHAEMRSLISEVREELYTRLEEAHVALNRFERTLVDRNVDLSLSLQDVIAQTPFWRPFESYRIGRCKRALDNMADTIFRSTEDITSLARCLSDTDSAGRAIVDSASTRNEFQRKFISANSVQEKIDLVRDQLDILKSYI
jgi:hypothetical protein